MARPSAFSVRLMVATNMMPPGFTISAQLGDEQADIGDVLDHFHVEDNVEFLAGLGEVFGRGGAVVDRHARFGCVELCDLDVGFGCVRADHIGSETGHRLAEQPAAAADIEEAQALERSAAWAVASETGAPLGRGYRRAGPD